VLGIVQVASSWESHAKAGVLSIEAVQKGIEEVNKKAQEPQKGKMEEILQILTESLTVFHHDSLVMLWDLEYFNKRATAQTAAVSL
jgi:hypothetical protein